MAKHDMDTATMNETRHELRFRPLLDAGRGYAFPCDAQGKVDLDALCERTRNDYFYARALIGRVYRVPDVEIKVACTTDSHRQGIHHGARDVAARAGVSLRGVRPAQAA
jgi:hypothetical protein